MQTDAAILWGVHQDWSVEPIDLDPPKAGEVLVKYIACGLCHSDEHTVEGDAGPDYPYPSIGGHEGAGIVLEVGRGVTRVEPGDHFVNAFIGACGTCPSCVRGHQNMCDNGYRFLMGFQADGTSRHHARGYDLPIFGGLGAFAQHGVLNELCCVKIPEDIPFDVAALTACGAMTGWGSSVYAAEVRPGDNVAIIGAGGVGSAALQGARLAGADRIFAIDPVPFKREMAPKFGATDTFVSVEEAMEPIQEITGGRMCDKVICTMGLGQGQLIASIMAIVAKRGRCVITNVHPATEMDVKLNFMDLTCMEKQIVGALGGSSNPAYDIPHLLQLYRLGHFDLEALITSRYKLGDINQGYQDMRDGKNIRGVLIYGE